MQYDPWQDAKHPAVALRQCDAAADIPAFLRYDPCEDANNPGAG